MLVLRLQHEDGRGIFTNSRGYRAVDAYAEKATQPDHPGLNPSPYSDGIPDFTPKHHCGFKDLAQLKKWFEDESQYHILTEHGFLLHVYDAPDETILEGGVQVMFIREQSQLLKTIPLEEVDGQLFNQGEQLCFC
jgi:hypothetical protein